MNERPVAVSIHQALGVSGVTVAGARIAAMHDLPCRVVPLVVGPEVSDQAVNDSALGGVSDLCIASWPANASVVQQVLTIREAIITLGAALVLPHDCVLGAIAAATLSRRGVRSLLWHHSSGHDGDDAIRAAGSLAHAFVAVDARLAERARRVEPRLPEPVRSELPVPVDIGREPLPRVPGLRTLRLIYAGRLECRHKRVLDLVRLCDALHRRAVRFFLTIVGDGPARRELESGLASHLAAGRVTMQGVQPPRVVASLFGAHDVGLLLSESEGMPLVVAECMAAGRPVAITQGCGGAVHAVRHGHNGWVVPVGDAEAMAQALADIALDRDRLVRMGREAHATARQRWSVDRVSPDLAAAFEAAMSSPDRDASPSQASEWWGRILHALGAAAGDARGPSLVQQVRTLRDLWAADRPLVGFDPGSLGCEPPMVRTSAAILFEHVLGLLRARGCHRIVVYGAGAHTRALARIIARHPEIAAIVDDAADGRPDRLAERPVITPAQAAAMHPDGVVVSSVEHEQRLLERAKTWAGAAFVEPLYAASDAALNPLDARAA
ncbi:MAG: glycosyltransferase family 4 protein [Phycisphaerae bacterium]